jgi:trans-aconitate methyltransferase
MDSTTTDTTTRWAAMEQSSYIHDLREMLNAPLAELERGIAPDDAMLEPGEGPAGYFAVAQSALRCLRLAMLAAGREQFQDILDFGCGHGRVLRVLKAAFPDARLTACDLLSAGPDYCASTFGATPVYSSKNPAEVPLHGRFDLIWCGSVLTCIPEAAGMGILELLHGHLSPGGC